MPNDRLRQNHNRKVGSYVNGSSSYVGYAKVEAAPFDQWINSLTPTLFNWVTVEYRQKNVGSIVEEIQPCQSMTCPKHCIALVERHENPQRMK